VVHQCYQQDIPFDLRGLGTRSAGSLTLQEEDQKQQEEFILEQRLSQLVDSRTHHQCLENNERKEIKRMRLKRAT